METASTDDKIKPPKSILTRLKSANVPLIWVCTEEDTRFWAEESQALIASKKVSTVYRWDATEKLYDGRSLKEHPVGELAKLIEWYNKEIPATRKPGQEPEYNTDNTRTMDKGPLDKSIVIVMDADIMLLDAHKVGHSDAFHTRLIKNSLQHWIRAMRTFVLISHTTGIPPELEPYCELIFHDKPDVGYMERKIDAACDFMMASKTVTIPKISLAKREKTFIAETLVGMNAFQAENALSLASQKNAEEFISTNGKKKREFDLKTIQTIKTMVVRKSGTLEVQHSRGGLDRVGSLDLLKAWFFDRIPLFEQAARDEGIPRPKGVVIVGPGGTGKSLTAGCLGDTWKKSVLSLSVGACLGSLMGESEQKWNKAWRDIKAQAPVIVKMDEFDKMFTGLQQGGMSDGGVLHNLYGAFLITMQELDTDVFVVAVANEVDNLPAPALRKGRFDEIWYAGFPGPNGRKEIFDIHLNLRNWNPGKYQLDLDELAKITRGFTGAEIESVVVNALIYKFVKFGNREKCALNMDHLQKAIDDTTPMYVTNRGEVDRIREWAIKNRIRNASSEAEDLPPIDGADAPQGGEKKHGANFESAI